MMAIYCQEIRASSLDFFSVPQSVAGAIPERDFTAASSRRDRSGRSRSHRRAFIVAEGDRLVVATIASA